MTPSAKTSKVPEAETDSDTDSDLEYKEEKGSFKDIAIEYIKESKYATACRQLVHNSA